MLVKDVTVFCYVERGDLDVERRAEICGPVVPLVVDLTEVANAPGTTVNALLAPVAAGLVVVAVAKLPVSYRHRS